MLDCWSLVCLNCNLWALTTPACADLANFGCISTGVLIHIGYAVISVWVDGRPGQYKVNIYRDLIIPSSVEESDLAENDHIATITISNQSSSVIWSV